jgi:DNA-binding transcriptional ArsR family regulator
MTSEVMPLASDGPHRGDERRTAAAYMRLRVYSHQGMLAPVSAPFDVLAEPTRRRILDLLLDRPRLVGELTEQLGLTQPGTSKHLRVLREAGLVRVRRDAQRRWYELRPEPLAEVDAWLEPYRRFWAGPLDALERHLDTMPDQPGPAGTP